MVSGTLAAGTLPANVRPYNYSQLKENEIRLLRLYPPSPVRPNDDQDLLTGELVVTTLLPKDVRNQNPSISRQSEHSSASSTAGDGELQYDAISYVWGGNDNVDTQNGRPFICIYLAQKPGGQTGPRKTYLSITPNLAAALMAFRSELGPDDELYLWVDALCIDQTSDLEKSEQIRMLSDIYSQAESVRIWLGHDDQKQRVQTAFKFIERILSFENIDQLVKESAATDEWDAFRALMQNSWFKRRWIVQEISFATKADVYCGKNKITWDEMKGAISLFVSVSPRLRQLFHSAAEFQHNPDYLGEIKAFGAKALVDVTKLMFRKSSEGHIMSHLLSLEALLTALTPFDAKLPHDSVYAIMSLSNDAKPGPKRWWQGSEKLFNAIPQLQDLPQAQAQGGAALPTEDATFQESVPNGESCSDPEATQRAGSINQHPPHSDRLSPNSVFRGRQSTRLETPHGRPRSRSREASPAAALREAEGEQAQRPRTFVVDYDKSMLSLCTEIYEFIVERYGSIDIMCKPWVPLSDTQNASHIEDQDHFPSWIQPLSKRPYGIRIHNRGRRRDHSPSSMNQRYERLAADPLVGTSLSGSKSYNASGLKAIPDRFIPGKQTNSILIDGRTLNACGFVLDTIRVTADPALNATIPQEWPTFAYWDILGGEDIPRDLWTTLVANRKSSDGAELPPDHWPYVCQWAFARKLQSGNLAVSDLLQHVHDKPSTQVLPFLRRLKEVIWNRRLFWSAGLNGQSARLGLAPREAQPGDLICILYGCSVPVLLRRKVRRKPMTSPRHKNVMPGARTRTWSQAVTNGSSQHTTQHAANNGIQADEITIAVSAPQHLSQGLKRAETVFVASASSSSALAEDKHSQAGAEVWSLIGECYVDGMMDGEAFLQLKTHGLVERDFKIGCTHDCNCGLCTITDDEF